MRSQRYNTRARRRALELLDNKRASEEVLGYDPDEQIKIPLWPWLFLFLAVFLAGLAVLGAVGYAAMALLKWVGLA